MKLIKVKNYSIVTTNELSYNYRLGLPIEVFCLHTKRTIAFGRIQILNDDFIQIHGHQYNRNSYLFFGAIKLEKSS
ncbi:hypothetical protein [Bacillus sp. JCM 19034]|uniref:hypothetical protein n=1 Tax=Bacillus sp. JCM 19034 TaxID=1481928 RepID=UPI0007811A52|nr:hypothetical protein [Bacillus sp. JCM 19034]